MQRRFGIELEGFGLSKDETYYLLRDGGVNIRNLSYTHMVTAEWKLVTDASVSGGWELVSPILQGDAGLAEVQRVTALFSGSAARVDRRCGFHVHVDANGLTADEIKFIVCRYAKYEDTIDRFMPLSRRSNNNHHCQSLRRIAENCETTPAEDLQPREFIRKVAEKIHHGYQYEIGRYHKVNVDAYLRHGTIEFRHHSGTLNSEKIGNWIRFCLQFVESSVQIFRSITANRPRATVPATSNTMILPLTDEQERNFIRLQRDYPNLTRPAYSFYVNTHLRSSAYGGPSLVFQSLCFHGSQTPEQLALRTGYAKNSVVSYMSVLRRNGVRIKKHRGDNGAYYLVDLQNVSTPPPATIVTASEPTTPAPEIVDDNVFFGMPVDVVSFYHERMVDLAS